MKKIDKYDIINAVLNVIIALAAACAFILSTMTIVDFVRNRPAEGYIAETKSVKAATTATAAPQGAEISTLEISEQTPQAPQQRNVAASGADMALPDVQVTESSAALSEEDEKILLKIAMAEAEGEDTEGKALVMCVVLNRVADDEFPCTISEVIYQEGQFSPVTPGGRYYTTEPDEDCSAALALVESGWDESEGATYFEAVTESETWHSANLDHLFDHGNHSFYK